HGAGHLISSGQSGLQVFRADDHGAEFVHAKAPAVESAALLPEEHRTARSELDENRDQRHRQREHGEKRERTEEVEYRFGIALADVERRWREGKERHIV